MLLDSVCVTVVMAQNDNSNKVSAQVDQVNLAHAQLVLKSKARRTKFNKGPRMFLSEL